MSLHNKITKSVLAVGLLGLLSLPLTALAVPVTVTVEGTTIVDIGTTLSGAPWSASVMYDTAVLPTSSGVNNAEWLNIPSFVYSLTVGAETFTFPPLVPLGTRFRLINDPGGDSIEIRLVFPYIIGGASLPDLLTVLNIFNSDGTMLATAMSLPLTANFSPLPVITIDTRGINGTNVFGIGTSIQIEVGTNPIPEPSTMLLFGTGLAGMVAWRFKKQHAKN